MDTLPKADSMDLVLYSLKASLQKYKGEGGLRRFLDTGRLNVLSFLGEFETTQDEAFTKRSEKMMKTRRCLSTLNDLFDSVDRLGSELSDVFSTIITTLHDFHQCCDNVEVVEQDDFEEKFNDLQRQNHELFRSIKEFSSLKATPKRMNCASIKQVEKCFLEASKIVGSSQTSLDVFRREVQVNEASLRKCQKSEDSVAVERALQKLENTTSAMEQLGVEHHEAVKVAMEKTTFALEQASMACWSSSNIFFSQLGDLFNGFGTSTRAIANICCLIKNMQSVSKRISEEKDQALSRAREPMRNGTELREEIHGFSGERTDKVEPINIENIFLDSAE